MSNSTNGRRQHGSRTDERASLRVIADELCSIIEDRCETLGVAVISPGERNDIDVLAARPTPTERQCMALSGRIRSLLDPRAPDSWTAPISDGVGSLFSCQPEMGHTMVGARLRIGNTNGLLIVVPEKSEPGIDLPTLAALAERMFDSALDTAATHQQLAIEHRRNHELSSAARVSRHVFHKLLEGGDTQAVLDHLSELVHKPVILYTPEFIVTAWSSPSGFESTTPPRVPVNVINQGWFAKTVGQLTRDQPCALVGPDASAGLTCRHLLGRLTVHDTVTGYLDIVGIGQEIQPAEINVAELAALALSMQQLSEMLQLENEGRDQEDYLSELLRSGNPERLTRRAPLFGVDLARKHVLVRVEYRTADVTEESVSGAVRRARMIEVLAEELVVGPPIAVGVPGADVLLLRVPRKEVQKEALTIVREGIEAVIDRLRGWVDVSKVLVSEPCDNLADYPPAHRGLFEFSQLADEQGWRDGVYLTTELGVLRLVLGNSAAAESQRFASRMLAALETYDVENGAQLVDTLRAFLEADGRIHQTAQRLEVHDNTIRYRIGRIENILERNIQSLDELMEFRVAFQIRDLYGEGAASTAGERVEPELRLVQG